LQIGGLQINDPPEENGEKRKTNKRKTSSLQFIKCL